MKARILGPLEVQAGAQRLGVGGARRQITIAMLLLSVNKVVPMERMLEAVYGENLPPTCRSQVQISISYLRGLFARHGYTDVITTHPDGYSIQLGPDDLDAQRFELLVAAAREAREAGDPERAVAHYRDALRLWQGPALHGIESDVIRAAAVRLDEQRLSTNEDRVELELELGRAHELVGELAELVAENPMRERLRGQLMLALHNCGRTAEALEVYRQGQATMAEELGIDPGKQLQLLHQAVLKADPVLRPTAEAVRPALPKQAPPGLLPTDIGDFTGREGQIEQIRTRLAGLPDDGVAVPVVVIVGKGGVGKTALAVHGAHAVRDRFCAGQLFADLHGSSGEPVDPTKVLQRFISALGVPAPQIPDGLDERAEMYRNLLVGRRVLIVLDDAATEAQVTPLLPGDGAAAVLVTARRRLTGIPGAAHLDVDVFDAHGSFELLSRIVGPARVRAQAQAAMAVAEHCGHLPLALRVVGARLSAQPNRSIEHLVRRLEDDNHRLDELTFHDLDVRTRITTAYDDVDPQARRLLRLLALTDAPAFAGWVGDALLDCPAGGTDDLFDDLVDTQLVEVSASGRYRLHELIRVFARERLMAEESLTDRTAARERMFGALLSIAEAARRRHRGTAHRWMRSDALRRAVPDRLLNQLLADPLSWCDGERETLVAGVRDAARAGLVDHCWSLALSIAPLLRDTHRFDEWRAVHEIALAATEGAKNLRGHAAVRHSAGTVPAFAAP
jgi:DNA-binding SARP family transcriptional activator